MTTESTEGGSKPVVDVLLVEDSADIRNMLQLMLETNGFHVLLADNGNQALQQFADGAIQAVVTDLRMPHVDGLDLARAIRGGGSQVPLLLVTAYSLDDERARAFVELPGTAAVSKSQVSAVAPALRRLLADHA